MNCVSVSSARAMQSALDGKKLPSLPLVVQKLIELVNAPNTETRQLASLIGQDPGIAVRVLRLANSPFYGLSGEVGSIQQAVVVLGFHSIAQLAASVGLMQAIKVEHCEGFDIHQFWASSMRTAAGARWLALAQDMNGENAYLAGLLHDIGLPVAAICFPDAMNQALAASQAPDQDLLLCEQALLGFDHLSLGAKLAQTWNVPALIVDSIAHYRLPPAAPRASLTDVLHVAWQLARETDATLDPEQITETIAEPVRTRLGLSAATVTEVLAELARSAPEIEALIHTAQGRPA
jgi:HD-like signal output (HDOD) protein